MFAGDKFGCLDDLRDKVSRESSGFLVLIELKTFVEVYLDFMVGYRVTNSCGSFVFSAYVSVAQVECSF